MSLTPRPGATFRFSFPPDAKRKGRITIGESVPSRRDPFTAEGKATHVNVSFMAVCVITAAVIAYHSRLMMPDDAFILMQYAKNLVETGEWTFNFIDTGNAATSPLYVLLPALFYAAGIDIEWTVVYLSVFSWAAVGGLSYYVIERTCRAPFTALFGTLFIVTGPFFPLLFGMESYLALCLQLIGITALISGRPFLLGGAFAAAFLARPESALLAVAIGGYLLSYRRFTETVKAIACGAAIVIPWFTYSLSELGTLFPSTVSAKAAQLESGWWGSFASGLQLTFEDYIYQIPLGFFGGVLLTVCGLSRIVTAGRFDDNREGIVLILALYLTGLFAVYHYLLGIAFYWWYATSFFFYVPFMIVLIASRCPAAGGLWAMIPIAVLAIMTVGNVYVNPFLWKTIRPNDVPVKGFSVILGHMGRVPAYRTIGREIKSIVPKGSTVATVEVGTLAWYSERPVIDVLGLDNPERARHSATRDVGMWLVETRPDYIFMPWERIIGWATPCIHWKEVSWFSRAYRPVASWSMPSAGGGRQVLYQRVVPADRLPEITGLPQVPFCMDYEPDLEVLRISEESIALIRSAEEVVHPKLIDRENVALSPGKRDGAQHFRTNSGPQKLTFEIPKHGAGDHSPHIETTPESPSARYFAVLRMKARGSGEGQSHDCCARMESAESKSAQYQSMGSFRVLLDGKERGYYIPLVDQGDWVTLEEARFLKVITEIRDGGFSIQSIRLMKCPVSPDS